MVPGPCQLQEDSQFPLTAGCDCTAADPPVIFSGERWQSGEDDTQCTYEYVIKGDPGAPEVGSWHLQLDFGMRGELVVFNEGEILMSSPPGDHGHDQYIIGPEYYRSGILNVKRFYY